MRFRGRGCLKEYIKLPEMKGFTDFRLEPNASIRQQADAQQVFLFSLGILAESTTRSCSATPLQEAAAIVCWKHFSLRVQILPFIQSTTWPELHLLTGSITSAMLRSLSPSGLTKGIPPTVPQKKKNEEKGAAEIKTHASQALPVNSRCSCATD